MSKISDISYVYFSKNNKKRKKGTSGRKLCNTCKDIKAGKRTR